MTVAPQAGPRATVLGSPHAQLFDYDVRRARRRQRPVRVRHDGAKRACQALLAFFQLADGHEFRQRDARMCGLVCDGMLSQIRTRARTCGAFAEALNTPLARNSVSRSIASDPSLRRCRLIHVRYWICCRGGRTSLLPTKRLHLASRSTNEPRCSSRRNGPGAMEKKPCSMLTWHRLFPRWCGSAELHRSRTAT